MKIRTLITAIVLASAWVTVTLYASALIVSILMKRAVPIDEMDRRRTAFREALAAGRGHRVGSPERTMAVNRAVRALFGVTPPHAEPIGTLIADEMRRHIQSTQQIDQIPDHLQRRAQEAFDKIRRAEPQVCSDVAGGAPSLTIEQIDEIARASNRDWARRKERMLLNQMRADADNIPERLQEQAREAFHRIQRQKGTS